MTTKPWVPAILAYELAALLTNETWWSDTIVTQVTALASDSALCKFPISIQLHSHAITISESRSLNSKTDQHKCSALQTVRLGSFFHCQLNCSACTLYKCCSLCSVCTVRDNKFSLHVALLVCFESLPWQCLQAIVTLAYCQSSLWRVELGFGHSLPDERAWAWLIVQFAATFPCRLYCSLQWPLLQIYVCFLEFV